jgi:hypothetical protein
VRARQFSFKPSDPAGRPKTSFRSWNQSRSHQKHPIRQALRKRHITQIYQQFVKSRSQSDSGRETITIPTILQSSTTNGISRGLHAQPWCHAEIPAYGTFAREVRGLCCNLFSPPHCPSPQFHVPILPISISILIWLKLSRLSLYFLLASQFGKGTHPAYFYSDMKCPSVTADWNMTLFLE